MTYIIKSNKIECSYNIDGIENEACNTQEERRDLLLQIIRKNPKILHTHVIKIAYELSKLAKKTIENELNRLEEDGLLQSTKLGTSPNASRMWESVNFLKEENLENSLVAILKGLSNVVLKVENNFSKLDSKAKAKAIFSLLNAINSLEHMINFSSKFFTIQKQQNDFDKIKNRVYRLLFCIPNDKVTQSLLFQHLLPDVTHSTKKLVNFLEEQKIK